MKMSVEALAGPQQINTPDSAAEWPAALWLTSVAVLALLGIYHSTFASMVAIWWRSETFAHGFIIFPVSIWLIWRERCELARIIPYPDYRALPLLISLGFAWLAARLVDVLVIEQLMLIGMIPVLIWLLLGWTVLTKLAFPLGFLLFAVPTGEALVPILMEFTADFTVKMLQITRIPVYREGTFFSIPSGDWSVVEACSGIRYLIASITLGFLYAYLSYRSMVRRMAFIVLALCFPIIANGLRAYMIVMIGHLSGMKLAVGVDHVIYGWIFFGIVMLFMFWIGSFWTEPPQRSAELPSFTTKIPERRANTVRLAATAGIALVISVFWPARAAYIDSLADHIAASVKVELPQAAGFWQTAEAFTEWEPSYVGPNAKAKAFYRSGADTVGLYVMYYRHQKQGGELINSQNVLVSPEDRQVWKMPEEKPMKARLNGAPGTVLQGRLHSPTQRLLTWRWNRISGRYTTNDYIGKLLEAKDKLLGAVKDGAAVILVTPYEDDVRTASEVLQRFVDEMLPSVDRNLNDAAQS
ncbi:exosortase A [Methylocaldum sp.]|uniref:exosortase A n=1 Tax=Methylocaldum sp. TaxID=1969727 RepID=UPI00321F8B75